MNVATAHTLDTTELKWVCGVRQSAAATTPPPRGLHKVENEREFEPNTRCEGSCMKMLSWARKSEKPKLFICGSQDQFTSSRQYRKYVRSFPVRGRSDSRQNPFACYLLDDVDHFWYGQEAACAGLILKFFEKRPGLVGREVSQKNS